MIHLDIIKYILNPLLNWDDCEIIPCEVTRIKSRLISLHSAQFNKKKHYSHVQIISYKVSFKFDDSFINIAKTNMSTIWRKDGEYHREDKDVNTGLTLPAIIWSNGTKFWNKEGKAHNSDKDDYGDLLPALMYSCRSKQWYINGEYQSPVRSDDTHFVQTEKESLE